MLASALYVATENDAFILICAKKRRKGEPKFKKPLTLGLRWPVERTNSWLSNFGQLRRNTDRFSPQRFGQIALAIGVSSQVLTLACFAISNAMAGG